MEPYLAPSETYLVGMAPSLALVGDLYRKVGGEEGASPVHTIRWIGLEVWPRAQPTHRHPFPGLLVCCGNRFIPGPFRNHCEGPRAYKTSLARGPLPNRNWLLHLQTATQIG